MTIDLLSIILIAIAAIGVVGLLLALFYRKEDYSSLETMEEESSEEDDEKNHVYGKTFEKTRIEPTISKESSFVDPTLASLGFNTMDVLPISSNVKSAVNIIHETLSQEPIQKKVEKETVDTKPVEKEKAENKACIQKPFISFYIVAPSNQAFVGYELHQAILSAGLHFGKMNIFHRHENADGTGEVLFSLASAVPPGAFDLANIGGFSCPGLSIFLRPKQTKDPLFAFDLMLETAYQLVDELGGELCDEESRPLSENDIDYMRSQIL